MLCLVTVVVSGQGVLVTYVLGTVLVSVHSLGTTASKRKVDVSVHSLRLLVGIVVVSVWQLTVVVVSS